MKNAIKFQMYKRFPKLANKFFFKRQFKQRLNLKEPKLYSEKIQWLKYYYAKNDLAILAGDKVGIREYLKNKNLEKLLVPIIGIYDNVDEIDWIKIPNRFVMKKSNSSGMNIIITNKKEVDEKIIKNKMNTWMKENYGVIGAEGHYAKMNSKIIIEDYMDGIGEDWRIIFLNGEPRMLHVSKWVGVLEENYTGHRESVRVFAEIDGKIKLVKSKNKSRKIEYKEGDYLDLPKDYDDMLKFGRIVARDFPLVRVDYFHANGILYIGELTFTPGSGFEVFNTEIQKELGELLVLPKESI